MEQTAVEWLVENTPLCKNDFYLEKINEAKEKFKQQIIISHSSGVSDFKTGEQYYNDTFKE